MLRCQLQPPGEFSGANHFSGRLVPCACSREILPSFASMAYLFKHPPLLSLIFLQLCSATPTILPVLTVKCTSGVTIRTYAKSARRRESAARRFAVFITAIKICHPVRVLVSPTLTIVRKKSSAPSVVAPVVLRRGRRSATSAAVISIPHSVPRARLTSVNHARTR